MTKRLTETTVPRRTALRLGAAAGTTAVGTLVGSRTATAQQGGVAYLKEQHLRGKNNPKEPRFKIVERCGTVEMTLPCESERPRTYAQYRIRCPNFGGGHGRDDGHDHESDDHDHDGCEGGEGGHGRCGRHILVNPNRRLETSLTQLYRFVTTVDCGDEYVRAPFRPVR